MEQVTVGKMEQVTFTRPPGLRGVELKSVYSSTRLWTRFNLSYAFCSIVEAQSRWRYRKQIHAASAGTVVLMEPGESHVTVAASVPATFRTLFIPCDRMDSAARELGWKRGPHLRLASTRNARVHRALALFNSSLDVPCSLLEREARLISCLRAILREAGEHRPAESATLWEPAAVRTVRGILQDRLADDVSLDELATAAGVSGFHLLRLFHAQTGMAPHRFQLQLRLARAKELLVQSVSPGEVAQRLGFFDQSHLNRHFSRTFGISPRRYGLAAGGT